MSVTPEHLDAAVQAGTAPLARDLALLQHKLDRVAVDVDAIARRLDARPVQRWLTGRATILLDRGLPLAIVLAAGWLLAHLT